MTDEQIESLLQKIVEQTYKIHCSLIALIQMLIDKKAFKGQDEASVMLELENRVKDIEFEDTIDARVKDRVRTLIEAWSKMPEQ